MASPLAAKIPKLLPCCHVTPTLQRRTVKRKNGTTTSTTSTRSTTAGGATAMPTPTFPPPPPFFMPPFSIPPPMPPQDFSGLTEDELKAMEGHERANVEARIKCLRNIQVLLDAAVMEMQQYSSVVGQLDMTTRTRPTGTTSSSSSSVPSTTSVVSSNTSATISAASVSNDDVKKPALPTAETGARPKVKLDEKKNQPTETTNAENNDDEQNEIRKRRLEKFGNANQNS